MEWTPVNAEGIFSYKDNLKISHAVKAGNTVYISGQVAWDPEGNVVGKGDIEAQTDYIWGNIKKVLEAAGSGLDKVVKTSQYVVGKENFAGMRAARRRVFGQEPFHSGLAVAVSGLVHPDLLVEIDVVAVTRD